MSVGHFKMFKMKNVGRVTFTNKSGTVESKAPPPCKQWQKHSMDHQELVSEALVFFSELQSTLGQRFLKWYSQGSSTDPKLVHEGRKQRVTHPPWHHKRHDRMWSPRSERAVISPLTRLWKIQESGQGHAWQKKLQGELHSLIWKQNSKNRVFLSMGKTSAWKRMSRRGGGPLGKEGCECHLWHDPTLWSQGLGGWREETICSTLKTSVIK